MNKHQSKINNKYLQQKPTGTKYRLVSYAIFEHDGALYIPNDSAVFHWSGTKGDDNFAVYLMNFFGSTMDFELANPEPNFISGFHIINSDSLHSFSWDAVNSLYNPAIYGETVFNANGKVESFTLKDYAGGPYVNTDKLIYTYDAAFRVTSETYQAWNGAVWENSAKSIFAYDANGNILSEINLSWNNGASAWDSTEKYEYDYDAQQKVTSFLYRTWSGAGWENSYRTTYTNSNGRRMSEVEEFWNTAVWEKDNKTDYVYNASGNRTSDIYSIWNGAAWDNDEKYLFDYDASDRVISVIDQMWDGTNWTYNSKIEYSYTGSNLTESIIFDWVVSTFENETKYDYTYNSFNQVLTYVSQTWNGTTWQPTNADGKVNFHYETFEDNTGIAQALGEENFSIFPNPAQDVLNIQMKNKLADKVQVIDMLGKVVFETKSKSIALNITIPTNQLADGVYYLKIQSGAQMGSKSFVVRH